MFSVLRCYSSLVANLSDPFFPPFLFVEGSPDLTLDRLNYQLSPFTRVSKGGTLIRRNPSLPSPLPPPLRPPFLSSFGSKFDALSCER